MSADDQLDMDTVRSIETSVTTLATGYAELAVKQARQIRKLRRVLIWTVVGLVLDLVLTAGGVYLYERSAENARRITSVQCSFYDLIFDSYSPRSPSAREDPATYERSFTTLERDAARLGCAHHTRGRD